MGDVQIPTTRQRFRLVADVYVEGSEGMLTEAEAASLLERAIPYGRTLRMVIVPQQVENDKSYWGEDPPASAFGER